jgi:choline-sulfatase
MKGQFPLHRPASRCQRRGQREAGPDGFVNLFNGKNLNGWDGDKQYWSVEEGAITGKTDGTLKMNRFLTWTGPTIRNFDLRVKVKVSAGGNSGLQYRGAMLPEVGLDIVSGYQCDIVANNIPHYNGMLYEERGRRILSHTGEKGHHRSRRQPWIVGKMEVKSSPRPVARVSCPCARQSSPALD